MSKYKLVPVELIEHVLHARRELTRGEVSPLNVRQRLAQKITDLLTAVPDLQGEPVLDAPFGGILYLQVDGKPDQWCRINPCKLYADPQPVEQQPFGCNRCQGTQTDWTSKCVHCHPEHLPAPEDGMCNSGDPTLRCVYREEFGFRVCALPSPGHWSYANPGLADQYRAEALAARRALDFKEDADDVAPVDITAAIASLNQPAPDLSELVEALERARKHVMDTLADEGGNIGYEKTLLDLESVDSALTAYRKQGGGG